MKYFINFYQEGNKVQKPSDGVSSGKWRQVDEETITPQYSLPEVRITGEHPIWSLPGYKGKQDKYRNFTKRDKDQIWRNTLEHNKRGIQYMKWAAPLAAAPVFFMTGAAGATGNALLNLGRSIITHPLRTAAEFVGTGIAGNTVDKTVQRTTGDENFGAMVGRVTNTPELNGLWQFGNPGYLAGGFAGDMTHRLATTGVKRVSPIISEHVSSIISRNQPMLQPAYVGGVPGTMRTPWTLYEPAASRTQNAISLGPVEISHQGIHRKPGRLGKPAESTSASGTTSTTVEQAAPKGIQVVDRRGNKKPVFKEGSKEVPVYSDQEVTHTAERPVYGEEQYNEFISPVQSGTTYGGIEFVPGAKPVQRTRTVQTGTEPYEYTTTERVQTGTKTVPNGKEPVLNDEVLNPATTYYNTKGKQLKKVRTNTGFGDYNLTTGLYQKRSFGNKVLDNMAQHPLRWGIGTTGVTMLVGLKNIPSAVKNTGKVVGNTMWNGIGSNFNTTSQQANDTVPETTPTNTPQTSDTAGRAARMAQRRRELGITE